jgi:hypothetical protein
MAGLLEDKGRSSMTLEGVSSSLAVEGATTAAVFEAYVEQVLAPTLLSATLLPGFQPD